MANTSFFELVFDKDGIQLYKGSCEDVLKALSHSHELKIQSVITSPPYANQRNGEYSGISEETYPEFTFNYFDLIFPLLHEKGSVFVNIRPHLLNGQISDYVLRTRLELRKKWIECEELIWIKPDSPPMGSINRPRRSWESILWYSKTGNPLVHTKASGKESSRIGFQSSKFDSSIHSFVHGGQQEEAISGMSRSRDYIEVGVSKNESGVNHPAMQPVEVPEWLIKLTSIKDDLILDPFAGSGTTGVACIETGRKFIGIELKDEYCDEAIKRFKKAFIKKKLPAIQVKKNTFLKSDVVKNGTLISF